jgi:transcriptional regulator with XRE-family HTH domain
LVACGERIRNLRQAHGWTTRELEAKIREIDAKSKVSDSTISRLERGAVARPSLHQLDLLASALDTTYLYLAYGVDLSELSCGSRTFSNDPDVHQALVRLGEVYEQADEQAQQLILRHMQLLKDEMDHRQRSERVGRDGVLDPEDPS